MLRIEITVKGIVQGVGFRYFVLSHAQKLNLRGYVKNVGQDKVEIVAEGNDNDIAEIEELCKKGPAQAHVKNITSHKTPAAGEFITFSITH